MKRWQYIVLLLLLAAGAWAVISYPVGKHVIEFVQSPTPKQEPITLLFVGDVMLARSVGDTMAAKNDWTWPFARIASTTRAADVAFANLETTISTRGAPSGCGYCFRADPRVTEGLRYAGFDALSVANNHIHDYGPDAFADTLAAISSSSMSPVIGDEPVIKTVRDTRIAYLAFAEPFNETRIVADITRVHTQTDVLIVSFHAGTEYELMHNATQERVYRAAVDAGADLVIGTHPHVVQDVEQYRGKWILYSLGNFVFDQNWSDATRHGLMVRATVLNGHITGVEQIPVEISKQYQASLRIP